MYFKEFCYTLAWCVLGNREEKLQLLFSLFAIHDSATRNGSLLSESNVDFNDQVMGPA